ncbi:TBC1 domain family member 13-like isoform X1 [Ananas comosus]|uniref:TBC1 domain family member 13-like isoform X1 n=1 Tax=Ananas comosus TaxID=4615 RepID=A0A6P5EZJ9_ANACO|nr:TBC1 domain family member 13-like isoform X1 [Ananas comosus]
MLLLRGKLKLKLKLLQKMRSVSDPPPHPPGAELQNRRPGGLAHSEEADRLEFQLSQNVINLEALQHIARNGLSHGGEQRATIWKQLFLGYLPVERDAWERELAGNRSRYAELKDELLAQILQSESSRTKGEASTSNKQPAKNDDDGLLSRREVFNGNHPLNLGNGGVWHQFFKDAEIAEQIDRDLLRTHPDIDFFSVGFPCSEKHRDAMRNILLLFAKLNPAIGYVQGMNEVLAPLYYVFRTQADEQNASNAEADSFGCFVRLLSGSVDHFCQQLDNSSVGIHSTLSRLSELLKANDEDLWHHLENTKVNPQFYAFRWITLLLTQEFKFHSIMRIWDCLLSNPCGVQEMLLRVCCAMLLCVKHELLNGDFASNLELLQHYPEIDLETLLDIACHLIPCSPTHLLHC